MKPEEGLSTKDVYAICDDFPRANIDTDKVIEGLANDSLDEISLAMGNDLMAPAESMLSTVTDIVSDFKKIGFKVAMMTGSGSSCFGLTNDPHLMREAVRHFEKLGHIVLPTKVII